MCRRILDVRADREAGGVRLGVDGVVRESTLERFKQSKDPDGRRWKTSIRAAQEGGKTLIQSAQLRNSIHAKSDASGFAVGTNVKYADGGLPPAPVRVFALLEPFQRRLAHALGQRRVDALLVDLREAPDPDPGRTIRARKKKALRFQVGGKWVTKKQVRITIPARPFLGLSEDDMQEMKATVEEFIQKED